MVGANKIFCCLCVGMLLLVLLLLKALISFQTTNYIWYKKEESYNEGLGCDIELNRFGHTRKRILAVAVPFE